MNNLPSKECFKDCTEDPPETQKPSETQNKSPAEFEIEKGDEDPVKLNQQLWHKVRVDRCLPQNKEYQDWMRSAMKNGGIPKVSANTILKSK